MYAEKRSASRTVCVPIISNNPSRHTLVDIKLFTVSGSPLKIYPSGLRIDQNVPRNDTNILSISKDIQQRRLPGSRSTHERSEFSWFDVSEDVVQQSQLLSANRNIVIRILPRQHPF